MDPRTIEDRLREEYFDLLPEITRAATEIDSRIRYSLLPISHGMQRHERLVVSSRIKSCESSIDKLRRLQKPQFFDLDRHRDYSLRSLKDLAAVRVMSFPSSHLPAIDATLKDVFHEWTADLEFQPGFKYVGYCREGDGILGEYQILPLLVGLFWEVEHATIYKPAPSLAGIGHELEMRREAQNVIDALTQFEDKFMKAVEQAPKFSK